MPKSLERVHTTNLINVKIIIAFIIGVILASGITVYATSYFAKDISYTRQGTEVSNVQEALNDLYSMKKSLTINETPFYSITGTGESYTVPRDCLLYIYAHWNSSGYAAYVYINGDEDSDTVEVGDTYNKTSKLMKVNKGDVIKTRSGISGLTYLLEFYDYE